MPDLTTLYKVAYGAPTPREVLAETPYWPNHDTDGDTIFENTHFLSLAAAWKQHLAEHKAGMSLAAARAAEARKESARRDKECADASIAYQQALDAYKDYERTKEHAK